MSCAGNKNVKLWDLNENGYLVKKFGKDKKQLVNNLFNDIQSHFGEVDFKSKLDQSGDEKDKIVSNLNDVFKKNNLDVKIYEDINTGKEWIDIMSMFAKLKNTFGSNWGDALKNYVKFMKSYQEKNMKAETKQTTEKKIEIGDKNVNIGTKQEKNGTNGGQN